MIMKNTSEMDFEFPLNPKILRENAEFICEAVESNLTVVMFKCGDCGRLHLHIVPDEDDGFQTNSIN
jgi:hypothetical protein